MKVCFASVDATKSTLPRDQH